MKELMNAINNKDSDLDISSIMNDIFNLSNTIPNLTDEEQGYLYNTAVNYMKLNDYKNALTILQPLLFKNPTNILYIKAVAGSAQMAENFQNAINMYQLAYSIDNSPDMLYYSGICAFKIDDIVNSKEFFTKFLESNYDNEDMNNRAILHLDAIKTTEDTRTKENANE